MNLQCAQRTSRLMKALQFATKHRTAVAKEGVQVAPLVCVGRIYAITRSTTLVGVHVC